LADSKRPLEIQERLRGARKDAEGLIGRFGALQRGQSVFDPAWLCWTTAARIPLWRVDEQREVAKIFRGRRSDEAT
jgi:hypothetical protein